MRLEASADLDALGRRLRAEAAELVVNLVESLDGIAERIHWVPRWLESLGIPFTGGGSAAIRVTSNKLEAKRRLRAAGLPTADWVEPGAEPPRGEAALDPEADLGGRLDRDRRRGRGRGGRRGASRALAERARRVGRAVFAEAYIEGRDFNVGLLAKPGGIEVLPPMEVVFENWPEGKPRIYGFAAKWDPDSLEWDRTRRTSTRSRAASRRSPRASRRSCASARRCSACRATRAWTSASTRPARRSSSR